MQGWGWCEEFEWSETYRMQICKKQFLVARDMILNCPIEIFDRIEHVEWFSFVSLKYNFYRGPPIRSLVLPCIRPSRDRGIRMQAVSLSLVVIALIKLFKVPFSCALRSLRTIKHFQPTVF